MQKKLFVVSCLVLLTTACTLNPPTDKKAVCDQARRQSLYNATNMNTEASYLTSGQQAKLQQTIASNCV